MSFLLLFCLVISTSAFLPSRPPSNDGVCGIHQRSTAKLSPTFILKSEAVSSSSSLNQTLTSSTMTSLLEEQQQQQQEESLVTVPSSPSTDIQQQESISLPPKNGKTAIVLNVNARSVTSDLTETASNVFGEENVYLTSTKEQAQQAARDIVQKQYSTVVPVGGDGTLSTLLSLLVEETMQQYPIDSVEDAVQQLPLVAYIAMGTGNGVGSVVGCKPPKSGRIWKRLNPFQRRKRKLASLQQLFEQVKQVTEAPTSVQHDVVELPMMQVRINQTNQTELCFFAGVGFDSLMLNDFKDVKEWSRKSGVLTNVLSSVTGYCVALVVKTLPKCAIHAQHKIHVEVTTPHPTTTTWIDHRRGDVMRRVSSNKLYSGETGILAAATTPFYGGNLRLFPFARMTLDKIHLRLGRIHPLTGVVNLSRIFQGSYRDASEKDFGCIDLVSSEFHVRVKSEGGFPFQHSGESIGHVEEFDLCVVKEHVKFISFLPPTWENEPFDCDDEASNDER